MTGPVLPGKTALEAPFPGNFAIYSAPVRADSIILVAWNFPLTSMKLYDCCPPLQCIQGGCAEKVLHNNVGFLPL